ncbi:MAG: alpha/beta hydrolase [Methylotenera sp.]|nr:alpha/beta hydrolase [Methylotenera sp.]
MPTSNTNNYSDAMVTPLILIPGLMCDHSVWSPLLPLLPHQQIQIADHGDSESLVDMAHRLLKNAPPRFDMAGHSMGGRVALEVYRLAPERVRRIALMNTGYLPLADGEAGLKERAGRMQLLAIAQSQGVRTMGTQWVQHMVAPARLKDVVLINAITDMFERKTATVFERQQHALLNRLDASDVLTRIHVPCLVMTGEHDAWADVAQHRAMADLLPAKTEVYVIANAGHMLTMEEPAAVAQVFLNWLN